jgi:hypothetical protein
VLARSLVVLLLGRLQKDLSDSGFRNELCGKVKSRKGKGFFGLDGGFCKIPSIPIAIHHCDEYSTVRHPVIPKPWKHHGAWRKHLTVDL